MPVQGMGGFELAEPEIKQVSIQPVGIFRLSFLSLQFYLQYVSLFMVSH